MIELTCPTCKKETLVTKYPTSWDIDTRTCHAKVGVTLVCSHCQTIVVLDLQGAVIQKEGK